MQSFNTKQGCDLKLFEKQQATVVNGAESLQEHIHIQTCLKTFIGDIKDADDSIAVSRTVERKLPVEDIEPLEVIDVITSKGTISRTFFDEDGRRRMRIDSTDHGFPTKHPMGPHKHIMVYDQNGEYLHDSKAITLKKKDRKENADIL